MKIDIKGSYKFKTHNKQGEEVILFTGENLITFFGESFFLNRPINNEFNTMKYIVLGNASNRPRKMDSALGNETIRKECIRQADLDYKRILLTCNFTTQEIIGTSEIGVANDTILISHDVYEKIKAADLTNSVGEITVEYAFQLSTSSIRTGWTQKLDEGTVDTDDYKPYTQYNIYYIDEPNEVIGVFEDNTQCGYRKVNSVDTLRDVYGAYFYNRSLNRLYIRNTRNNNPDNDTILVQTK